MYSTVDDRGPTIREPGLLHLPAAPIFPDFVSSSETPSSFWILLRTLLLHRKTNVSFPANSTYKNVSETLVRRGPVCISFNAEAIHGEK